jgi:uncharacterized protein
MSKLSRLKEILNSYSNVMVAYSGGVDSSFLLYCAKRYGRGDVIAVTGISETYTKEELQFANKFCKQLGLRLITVRTSEFDNPDFIANSERRCYYCKRELFSKIEELRKREGCDVIFDGTNYSDKFDYRPGSMAKKEFNIVSPLEIAGFTKEDIRRYSKRWGITGYDRPSNACLASRIPYHTKIDRVTLRKIYAIESFIKSLGIKTVRLRHHKEIARIETSSEDMSRILKHRDRIIEEAKKHGYIFVALDLEGYKTGSLNRMRQI